MKVSEHQLGIKWIHQFTGQETHLAKLLLDYLQLVSHSNFEACINQAIEQICADTTGPIALFTPEKRLIDPEFSNPGSEDRLAHIFRNIQRQFPDRILIKPTLDRMREAKVKHVVIVDDFVGSGQRIENYWDVWASTEVIGEGEGQNRVIQRRGRLRSWLSFGYCKLWLVGYAIHEQGLQRVLNAIPYLDREHTRFQIRLPADEGYWPLPVRDFFEKNEARTRKYITALGGADISCPLVFQHGCPDNCPAILWTNGSAFQALFPNRAIPTTLYSCFEGGQNLDRGAEVLRRAGQKRLALSLIEKMSHNVNSQEYSEILTLLGLLLRGIRPERIPQILLIEEVKIQRLLDTASELGLIDDRSKVTSFGRDLVKRTKATYTAPSSTPLPTRKSGIFYVPKSFRNNNFGVQ